MPISRIHSGFTLGEADPIPEGRRAAQDFRLGQVTNISDVKLTLSEEEPTSSLPDDTVGPRRPLQCLLVAGGDSSELWSCRAASTLDTAIRMTQNGNEEVSVVCFRGPNPQEERFLEHDQQQWLLLHLVLTYRDVLASISANTKSYVVRVQFCDMGETSGSYSGRVDIWAKQQVVALCLALADMTPQDAVRLRSQHIIMCAPDLGAFRALQEEWTSRDMGEVATISQKLFKWRDAGQAAAASNMGLAIIRERNAHVPPAARLPEGTDTRTQEVLSIVLGLQDEAGNPFAELCGLGAEGKQWRSDTGASRERPCKTSKAASWQR